MATIAENATANLIKRANLEDEVTLQAYEVFDFTTAAGKRRSIQIERARACVARSVHRALLDANAALPSRPADAIAEVEQAIEQPAPQQLRYAARLGWRPDGKGFVLSDCCVGRAGRRADILPPSSLLTRRARVHSRRGALKQWQRQVAAPACSSTPLTLGIAAAFAAPLVKIMRLPNFGISLAGLPVDELELVLRVASSVAGIATAGNLPAVDLGLFGPHFPTGPYNDLLFAASNWSPWARNNEKELRQLLHCIERATAGPSEPAETPTTTPSPGPPWRGIFLLGCERTFSERAAAFGIPLGFEARERSIDIPLNRPQGLFDRAPAALSRKRRRRWARAQLAQINDACLTQHGSALRPYLRFLMQNRKKLPKIIGRWQAEFLAAASEVRRSERLLERLLASRIALIYAGGCLAIECKLLPCRHDQLRSALLKCLHAANANLRPDDIAVKAIRRILDKRLHSGSLVPVVSGERFGPAAHPGFYREIEGRRQFTVAAKAFRRWFSSPAQCRAAVRWLHKTGRLELRGKRVLPSSSSTEWAERTPRWPDGSVHRSFVFFWDLEHEHRQMGR